MKTLHHLSNFFIAVCLLLGTFASLPVRTAQASALGSSATGTSPESYLNGDGTLKLDGNFSGSFDLSGWNVELDPVKGPVFAPLAAIGDWSTVGTSASPINGPVYSILVSGSDIYVAGEFKDVAGINEADYIARWDGFNWYALGNNGAADGALTGAVEDMVMVGSTLYVGGEFYVEDAGNSVTGANFLAKWDGANWSAVDGGSSSAINDWVFELAVHGTAPNIYLYVGGSFSDAAGIPEADYVARLNLNTNLWSALGSNGSSNGSLNGNVYALALDSIGNVYVGGGFTNVNDGPTQLTEADYIAKWNGTHWSALGNNGAGIGALNGFVGDIVVDGSGSVYAGGNFDDGAGIAAADYVAKWNGTSWSALGDDGFGGGALLYMGGGTAIQDMLLVGTDLYVGGPLMLSTNNAGTYLAKYDTNANIWSAVGGNGSGGGSLNQLVYALTYASNTLYVGGDFYKVNNGGTVLSNANKFASYTTGNGWSGFSGNSASLIYDVNAIAVDGTDVYVGGTFQDLNGNLNIDCIAMWDGTQWSALGNDSTAYGSINGSVQAIVISGDDIYVGGGFTNVNNSGNYIYTADRIAKWDKTTQLWSALGSNGSGDGAIGNGYVYAIAVNGSDVYVGGSFTNAAGLAAADYIARFDGTNWSALGDNNASGGSLNNIVFALAIGFGSNLYVGGAFTDVNNYGSVLNAADYIAKWDPFAEEWSALSGPSAPLSYDVYALAISGSDLYVGGGFINANGIPEADRLAKYTPTTGVWAAVGGSAPNHALNGNVYAIYIDGTDIYVGGAFTNVYQNGAAIPEADYVAKWNGTTWSALGNNNAGNGSLNYYVNAIAKSSGDLFVGGEFKDTNNKGVVLKNADFIAAYGVSGALDTNPPSVISIERAGKNPSSASSVAFTVSFSEIVTGVNAADFALTTTGVLSSAISGVTGSGALYTVTVNTGAGNGTIRLDVMDNDSIKDGGNNPLGGVGNNNGNFIDGEVYNITKPPMSSWVGGVSIESDKNVVAVGRPHIGAEVAAYDGFASGSLNAYVPMLFRDAFGGSYDSALYVQNVHATNTANVTIKYYDNNGNLNCTKADTIAPLASKGYWLPSVTCDSGALPTGWVGGVKVESNQPMVAVGRPHIGAEVMTYNGFDTGSLSTYIPMLFKGAFGGSYNAAFYVQNVDESNTANVTIEYYDNNGVLNCTKADTIAPLASKGYWVPAATCDSGSLPAGWTGGVVVTSDQLIVGVGRPHIGTQITTYDGFAAGNTSTYIPMLFKGAFGGSYNAAFYVQNVHANNTANITIQYYDSAGNLKCTKADTIAPLASMGYWVPSATCDSGSLPAGWSGGVVVTSDQPIVGVGRPHIGAQVLTYNGFTGGSVSSYLPMLFKNAFGGSYNAAFYIQNTEASAASVTVKFYDSNGSLSCVRTDTIPALSTLGFWLPSVTC